MKRESLILLQKSTDSILLSIEHFNRPWDRGRHEAVLVLLDRSFELLLKSIIVYKGGRIRDPRATETIGFDACVRKCISDVSVKCLTEEEALTIQIINSLRDAAQHYIVDVSEQQMYTYTQSALSLYNKLLIDVFGKRLSDYLPDRVLPVSSNPPTDFGTLMDIEFEDIQKLVKPRSRHRIQAQAKLRSFAIVEASLGGKRSQPSEADLKKLTNLITKGKNWSELFPNINRIALSSNDDGIGISLRISKSKGQPIHLVPEGTPGATVVAVKRVDELGFYSLSSTSISKKIALSIPKTLALVKALSIQDNPEYFKEFVIGSLHLKRYSKKALEYIKTEMPKLNIDEVWQKYGKVSKRIKYNSNSKIQ